MIWLMNLLDIALEVLALNQIRDIILIIILLALGTGLVLLHVLVALGELAEGGEAVGAKLVQDTGDELGELLLLAVAVEGEGVGGDGGVDYTNRNHVSGLGNSLCEMLGKGVGTIYP